MKQDLINLFNNLNIGPRQSGRTTRLVVAAKEIEKYSNLPVTFIVANYAQGHDIKTKYNINAVPYTQKIFSGPVIWDHYAISHAFLNLENRILSLENKLNHIKDNVSQEFGIDISHLC